MATTGPSISFSDLLAVARRRLVTIAVVGAVATVLGVVVVAQLPDVFQARMVVHVEPARIPESFKQTGALVPKLSQLVGLLRQEVLSRDSLRTLVNELALYGEPPGATGEDPMNGGDGLGGLIARLRYVDPVERARRDIKIDIVKRFSEDFVEISVLTERRELAARAVNRIADLLSTKNRQLRLRQEQDAKAFLETQLVAAQRRVQETETALVRFREANFETLPENAGPLLDRLAKLQFDNDERRARISRAEHELAAVRERIAVLAEGGRPPSTQGDRAVLEAELDKLEAEEQDLLSRGYGPAMPALVKVRGRIARTRKRLDELRGVNAAEPAKRSPRTLPVGVTGTAELLAELKDAPLEVYSEVERLLAGISMLSDTLDSLQSEVQLVSGEIARLEGLKGSLGATRARLERLDAEHDRAVSEHQALLNDIRALERLIVAEEAGRTDQFRTIEAAETPVAPVAPNRLVLNGLALVVGLGVGFGAGYLLDLLRRAFRDPPELESEVGVPVLAVLPALPPETSFGDDGEPRSNGSPLSAANGLAGAGAIGRLLGRLGAARRNEVAAASFVSELTRVRHAVVHNPTGAVRTILVTSAVSGEGKTTIATGLARSFARSLDHWALLVEGDLRRPVLEARLDIEQSAGLAGHICDGIPLVEVIRPTGQPKLSVIPAGRRSLDAADVMASAQMRRITQEMKERYPDRYIVIDAPPVLATPETVTLATLVDGVIFVVRAGSTKRDLVREALRALPREKVLGVVLNGLEPALGERYHRWYDERDYAHVGDARA